MKTKLFFLILLFVITFGCKEEKKIELVPTGDVYFPINEVDEYPELVVKTKGQANKEIVDLLYKINDAYQSISENEKKNFKVEYKFLINEKGFIDKVQIIKSTYPKIDNLILEEVKSWEYKPALKLGKKVKSILPFQFDPKSLDGVIQLQPDTQRDIYFVAVEEMPEVIGGLASIQSKITYPEIAKRAGIEGKVYVLAFIDEDGNVANAKIIKGIGAGCDEAALDAVKQTKFTPGRQRGTPVKVQVSIPIVFKLQ